MSEKSHNLYTSNNYLVAIPVYNEEKSLSAFLNSISFLHEHILIVNDGSTDASLDLIKKSGLNYLSYPENMGLGRFFDVAFNYAREKQVQYLITMDGDGQHDVRFLSSFIKEVNRHGLVIGDRFKQKNQNIPLPKQRSNSFASNMMNKHLGTHFNDVACGFRAYDLNKFKCDQIAFNWPYSRLYYLFICHIKRGGSYKTIAMPAIYQDEQVYYTPTIELLSLTEAITVYFKEQKYSLLYSDFLKRISTKIQIKDKMYYFYYLPEYDGYEIRFN